MHFINMKIFRRYSDVEAHTTGRAAAGANSETVFPFASTSKFSPSSNENGPQNTPVGSEKLAEFLKKYDPEPTSNLPALYPMSEHRAMMRTMYLDNILWITARLHKHNWILMSQNERYKE
jgi:hypothetical protein